MLEQFAFYYRSFDFSYRFGLFSDKKLRIYNVEK